MAPNKDIINYSQSLLNPYNKIAHCLSLLFFLLQSAFAKKRQEEIEEEEKALCDLVNHEVSIDWFLAWT